MMLISFAKTCRSIMRTTLDINEDVLLAAKSIAARKGTTTGKAVSELLRQALAPIETLATRNDIPLFPPQPDAGIVTPELVNRLRDEAP